MKRQTPTVAEPFPQFAGGSRAWRSLDQRWEPLLALAGARVEVEVNDGVNVNVAVNRVKVAVDVKGDVKVTARPAD